jgi:hypothetical protein
VAERVASTGFIIDVSRFSQAACAPGRRQDFAKLASASGDTTGCLNHRYNRREALLANTAKATAGAVLSCRWLTGEAVSDALALLAASQPRVSCTGRIHGAADAELEF